jgi:FKBP-type peptidyl-prolyl cis-trans isomerase
VRSIAAIVIAAAIAATLAGCATTDSAGSCTPGFAPGDASKLVTATGDVGTVPTVNFPTPLLTTTKQASVLTVGTGALVEKGDYVDLQASLVNGETGVVMDKTSYTASTFLRRHVSSTDAIGMTAACAHVGSRIASVLSVKQLFGAGKTDPSTGLTDDSTVILVIDVQGAYPGKAWGTPQLAETGMPSVVTTPSGVPGVTVLNQTPPTTLRYSTLKLGDGQKVKAGDGVVVQYTALVWGANTTFKSTWADAAPPTVAITTLAKDATNGLVPGLVTALTGQRIGSQVLVVVPPADAFAKGSEPAGVTATDTLIYVVDLLGLQ